MSTPTGSGSRRQQQRPQTSDTGSVRTVNTGATRTVSRRVYRRRRIVAGVLLLLALALIGAAAWGIWKASQPSQGGQTPTPSGSTLPIVTEHPRTGETIPPALQVTPAPSSAVPPKCGADDVHIEALTSATDFGPGAPAELGIQVTSQIGTACSINIGTATQSFTISSGNDVWWRSTDCQVGPSDQIVTLEPGQVVRTDPLLQWDRMRSSAETCTGGDREQAPAGFYRLDVGIANLPADKPADFGVWNE